LGAAATGDALISVISAAAMVRFGPQTAFFLVWLAKTRFMMPS
jgi:hypothetical protein